MLYIKFTIENPKKLTNFNAVYQHMCAVRTPGYQEKEATIDWETATDADIEYYMDEERPKIELFNQLFPMDTQQFLSGYFEPDSQKSALERADILPFFNYLEYDFEVDLDALDLLENKEAIIKFSTGNYPFGGMDRFIMTLKAFELNPIECFDGFNVFQFEWITDYEYDALILSEKTTEYLKFLRTF